MELFSSTTIISELDKAEKGITWTKLAEFKGEKSFAGIFGSRIRFLNDSLLKTTEVSVSEIGDKTTKWLLRFFAGSKPEVIVRVFINDRSPNLGNKREKGAFNGNIRNDKTASCRLFHGKTDIKDEVSEFLRGSKTFDLSEEAKSHSPGVDVVAAGPKSCLVIQDAKMKAEMFRKRFERLVLLQTLALAYRSVIDSHALRQTNAVLAATEKPSEFEGLRSLREEVVSFDAAFVFDKPLRNDGQYEVAAFWEVCSSAFGLRWRLKELNHQNDSVYSLLARKETDEKRLSNADRRAHEKKIEKRQTRWNTSFGVLLAVIGIGVTLVEPAYNWGEVKGWAMDTGQQLVQRFD